MKKYGADHLYEKCIEASENIHASLLAARLNAMIIEGYCYYDDNSCCSDRNYNEYTWVQVQHQGIVLYVDMTATQFKAYIEDEIPAVIIEETPYYTSKVLRETEEY